MFNSLRASSKRMSTTQTRTTIPKTTSAIAAKTLLRSEIGATVPLFVNQMFHGMGFQYAGLLLALVSVAIAPIPFVFFKYGEKIRKRSAMASQASRQRH